ncbi:MAPEG family protein [Erythrobacter sp.]|uniref:MAPEG family protein n=1 Tax=Erythrobacter sp. TaxID=1042 RepID=UPI00343869A5
MLGVLRSALHVLLLRFQLWLFIEPGQVGKPRTRFGLRVERILQNQVESGCLAIPVLSVAALTDLDAGAALTSGLVYILARVAFAVLYYLGIPAVRGGVWTLGNVALLYIVYELFSAGKSLCNDFARIRETAALRENREAEHACEGLRRDVQTRSDVSRKSLENLGKWHIRRPSKCAEIGHWGQAETQPLRRTSNTRNLYAFQGLRSILGW